MVGAGGELSWAREEEESCSPETEEGCGHDFVVFFTYLVLPSLECSICS